MKKETTISSPQNDLFKTFKSLLSSKGIKEHGQFFLMGEKLIREFLKNYLKNSNPMSLLAEILPEGAEPLLSLEHSRFRLKKELFNELDVLGTHHNLLLLEIPEVKKIDTLSPPVGLEVVAPLGDPGNLGALIRSCVAFNVQKIILTKESAHPFHPKVVKASAGSVLQAPLVSLNQSLKTLTPGADDFLLATEGKSLYEMKPAQNIRFWIGEEGPGLPGELLQKSQMITIPTKNVESLNAVVAGSIVLSHWKNN